MKLAITAQGGTSDSPVDQRFGRAEWLLIHDTESSDWKALENNDPAQGAGLKVAEMLANQGVENVITGHCGPKAFKALQAAGIESTLSLKALHLKRLTDFKRAS